MQQLGLLTPAPSHRFVHLIVQDAIETMTTVEERERLHLRAAALLHGAGHSAEQVAAHLLAVTTHQDPWAIEALRCAADTAHRRLAPDVAARYLRRALLDCSLDGEDRAALLLDLATAERCFDPAASLRHISQAVPLLKTVSKRAAAVVRIAPTMLGSSPASLLDLVQQVADELGPACALPPAERELRLRLEARLRYCGQDDPVSLGECVDRLHALGPEPPLGTAADRELLMVLLRAAALTGQLSADRVAHLGNAILQREPASQAHLHTALPALITTLVSCDSIATVSGWLEIALEQARRCEDIAGQAAACAEQALVLMAMGRLPGARERVRELFELGEPAGELVDMTSQLALTLFAVETRDTTLSERLLQQGHRGTEGVCTSVQRHLLWASGAVSRAEPALALEHVTECGGQLERAGWRNAVLYPWRPWAASLHYKLGHIDQAHDLLAEEYTRAMAWGTPMAIGRALRIRGKLAGRGQDIALLHDAVEVLSDSANQLELAKAVVLLGRRMRIAGLPDAEDYLRRGYQLAGACGAPWLVDHAIAQPGRPAGLSNLTKTERKVAGLAVRGQTNQEIADSFGVSCRAVEKHLTNVYRKLSVTGRTGLVAAQREAALEHAE
jgi:DNA-binding CsgD family transcriptional regulator